MMIKKQLILLSALAVGIGAIHAQEEVAQDEANRPDREKPGINLEIAKEFRELDRDNDGSLSRREFAATEIAKRAHEHGGPDRVKDIFDRIDQNDDGGINLFEYAESMEHRHTRLMDRDIHRRFDELDKNGDGVISFREFANSRIGELAKENGNLERLKEIFDKMDLNDTGYVGPFEFAYAHKKPDERRMDLETATKFAKMDANDDGVVKRREFADSDLAKRLKEAGKEDQIPVVFNRMDANGNFEISPGEFAKAHAKKDGDKGDEDREKDFDPEIVRRFKALDLNDDRSISLREFYKSPIAERIDDRAKVRRLFDHIDKNDDESISLREFAAAWPFLHERRPDRDRPGGDRDDDRRGRGKGGRR